MVSIRIMKVVPEKTGSTYCSPLVTIEIRNDGAEDLVFDHFSTKYFLEVHAKTGPVLTLDESMRLNMLYSRTTRDAASGSGDSAKQLQ